MSVILIDNIEALAALLAALAGTIKPVGVLYVLLAGAYARAAVAAGANDHHALRRCYRVSAVLAGLIGVYYHLHS
jgi:hypothetical protein